MAVAAAAGAAAGGRWCGLAAPAMAAATTAQVGLGGGGVRGHLYGACRSIRVAL